MSRSTPEWKGKTDDTVLPARAKIRIFDAFKGCCAICGNRIMGSLRPAYDHRIALINGGRNVESNFQLLCVPCHKDETGADVKIKAKTARIRKRHLGIRKPSKFPGSRDSKFKKKIDGTVVRRD